MSTPAIPSAQPAPVPALAPLTGRTHELKTDAHVFSEVTAGRKLFEIRKNDRDFRCGDLLRLRSTRCTGAEMAAGQPLIYTGEEITVRVIGILRGPVYGLAEGWVIMSIAAPAATQAQAEPVLWVNAGTLELVRMAGKATISASSEKNAEEGNGTPLYTRPAIASAPVGDGAQPEGQEAALLEAVSDYLETCPCECSDKRRYEDGEHLSSCHLFDLSIAWGKFSAARAAQAGGGNHA